MSIANDASASSVNGLSGRGAFIHAKKGNPIMSARWTPLVYTRLRHRSERENEGRGCSKKRIREQKSASAAAAASWNIRESIVTGAGREAPTMDAEEKIYPMKYPLKTSSRRNILNCSIKIIWVFDGTSRVRSS